MQLDAKDYRNADFKDAERIAVDEASRMAESQVLDAIEENLPDDEDESEWNWAALATTLNTRWGLNLRDRDLKKIGRENLSEELIKLAHEAIERIDLSSCAALPGAGLRRADGVRAGCATSSASKSRPKKSAISSRRSSSSWRTSEAIAAYDQRESEYPVLAGLYRFSARGAGGQRQGFLREDLVEWAKRRFDAELTRRRPQEQAARGNSRAARRAQPDATTSGPTRSPPRPKSASSSCSPTSAARTPRVGAVTGHNGKLDDLTDWLKKTCDAEISSDELAKLDREAAWRKVSQVVEDHFRPEMRRMERALLLQILDTAWKEHLLAMDHLRSSVGLRGYAQVDPKVEYKREGMALFEQHVDLGRQLRDRPDLQDGAARRRLRRQHVGRDRAAIKEDAPPASEIERQQQAAIAGTEADKKLEPIRNREPKVGRNDPCPCGSGKKYKQCCMRKSGAA